MARYIECEVACAEVDKGDLLVGNNAEFAKEIINRTPTADVVPKSEVIKEFAERLKKYYSHLDGKSPTPLIVYHIDQIEKEMLEGIKKGAADTHNDQRDTAD